MTATRIIKEVTLSEYREIIEKHKDRITVNPHAYFRIDEGQRKVYNDEYLISTLRDEKPPFVGMQHNGRYAAFFKRKEGYLRIMFNINHPKNVEIVTFYMIDNLPKV